MPTNAFFCPRCATRVAPGTAYCPKCQAKIGDAKPIAPPPRENRGGSTADARQAAAPEPTPAKKPQPGKAKSVALSLLVFVALYGGAIGLYKARQWTRGAPYREIERIEREPDDLVRRLAMSGDALYMAEWGRRLMIGWDDSTSESEIRRRNDQAGDFLLRARRLIGDSDPDAHLAHAQGNLFSWWRMAHKWPKYFPRYWNDAGFRSEVDEFFPDADGLW